MDTQEDSLPTNYFGSADEIPEILEPHTSSTAADGNINFSYTSSAVSAHIPAMASPYSLSPAPNIDTSGLHTSQGWHSSGHSSLYSSDESAQMAANPTLNPFNFQHEPAVIFSSTYGTPSIAAPHLSPFPWDMVGQAGLHSDIARLHHIGPGDQSSSSMGPTGLGLFGADPGGASYAADQHGSAAGTFPAPSAGPDESRSLRSSKDTTRTRPQSKRAKTAEGAIPPTSTAGSSSARGSGKGPVRPPMSPPAVASSSKGGFRPATGGKARSASRASKSTTAIASQEVPDEKSAQGSHNLVEKQYRNRLNAQFEGLMGALPESLKAQGGGPEFREAPTADAADRRISKAEVLDMARRYIQSLEQERDLLARERNELQEEMAKLKREMADAEPVAEDMEED